MRSVVLLLLLGGVVFATTYIDTCGHVLDSAGTYVIDDDLNIHSGGKCIRVSSNNVEIDCGGHPIHGSSSGIGIYIDPEMRNTVISNCNLNYLQYGVQDAGRDTEITDCSFDANQYGVYAVEAARLVIDGCTFTNNRAGVSITDSYAVDVHGSSFSLNKDYGVESKSSSESIISYNTFDKSATAIYLDGLSQDSTVTYNNITNSADGISIRGGGSTFTGNAFSGNSGYAFLVARGLNTFTGNTIYGQSNYVSIQSVPVTFINLSIGQPGEPGSVRFDAFKFTKPTTSAAWYDFNSDNMLFFPEFVAFNAVGTPNAETGPATFWLSTTACEGISVFTKAGFPRFSGEIVSTGHVDSDAEVVSCGDGVAEITVNYFSAYALGASPEEEPEPEPEEEGETSVTAISISAPSTVYTDEVPILEVLDQDGSPVKDASIYYYTDPSDVISLGETSSQGRLPFNIKEEGSYVLRAEYEGLTTDRAINVQERPPAEETEAEESQGYQLCPAAFALLALAGFILRR